MARNPAKVGVYNDRPGLTGSTTDAAIESRGVSQKGRNANKDCSMTGTKVVRHGFRVRPRESSADTGRQGERRVE